MALRGLFCAAIFSGYLTSAAPTIAFPLNSQVLPAARVSKPYIYSFPDSTFSSSLPMTYNLSYAPSWLSLNSGSRTLTGTPLESDAGPGSVTGVPIGLTATDSTGTITLNATLVVARNPAPLVNIPASQLQSTGVFSAPSTLLYHPSTPFKFNFEPGTFLSNTSTSDFSYYAVTAENTPLPSWIIFDGSSLGFSGQTPDYNSLIQPPQTFGIQLIASDIEGFGGASIFFDIEVGVHLLAFNNSDLAINASAGDEINYDGLAESLELDGQFPRASDIASISAETPTWMSFDNSTFKFTGKVPAEASSVNITVLATDIYGDSAEAVVEVTISSAVFSKPFEDANATIGSMFTYDLRPYISNTSDILVTAQIPPAQTWLSFDASGMRLAGQVSQDAKPAAINVTITADSKSRQISNTQYLEISLVAAANRTSSSSISSRPSGTSIAPTTSRTNSPTHTTAATVPTSSKHNGLSTKVILAIAIPIGVVFFALLVAFCCYRRRRHTAKNNFGGIEKRDISSPLEATSSVVEIVPPIVRTAAPPPLQLDMSGFGVQNHTRPGAVTGPISGAETTAKGRAVKEVSNQQIRRSQTSSGIFDPRKSQLRESYISGDGSRARSKSDNALSNQSWSSTQDSAYPALRSSGTSSSGTRNLARNYSNYSRKGHARRSGMVFSSTPIRSNRESVPPLKSIESPILNMSDSDFSIAPLEELSAIPSAGSARESTTPVPSAERPPYSRANRRQSKLLPAMDRTRSIGHGRRGTISSFSDPPVKRRSIGHGQDWATSRLSRDSSTWLTVAENDKRNSNTSASSTYTEPKAAITNPEKTIRAVTKSPSIAYASTHLSSSSNASRLSRPVSRRIGSSPFFGGSFNRTSDPRRIIKTPGGGRTSYSGSPTVPEEAVMDSLEETITQGLRELSEESQRDSFGISYGLAREGTRQLRSYVQGHLRHTRTRSTLRSSGSRDSRFESATPSMMSLPRSRPNVNPSAEVEGGEEKEYTYEDFLAEEDLSDGSWETQRSARDEFGHIIRAEPEIVESHVLSGLGASRSTPSSPLQETSNNAAKMGSVGRRPASVDAVGQKAGQADKRRVDYTAYI